MYKHDLRKDENLTQRKLWNMKTETGKSSHCRGRNSRKGRGRVWGVAALTGYGIIPVDRIMSKCVIEGNVRGREGTVGISTGRCLRGLKWY